ncbi:uncharacterized protein ASCRUDRAFT_68497 [Ascoidea rubescens DSM 1968]|uniref:Uncharacterized protein n=1 Tax=Ascoidea rubescens DSM 1968 TaxID=1344418 RepID=A0A1D2VSF8_9ASCO|nr:hypothetical protein ASCRUDRAFT_68497 [Ascoidea rubescens DSM 1968]ODV64529.1 hypothetical protein ASCRUDRAFT_68497 [Ascoidea rubescens DSM 1968]
MLASKLRRLSASFRRPSPAASTASPAASVASPAASSDNSNLTQQGPPNLRLTTKLTCSSPPDVVSPSSFCCSPRQRSHSRKLIRSKYSSGTSGTSGTSGPSKTSSETSLETLPTTTPKTSTSSRNSRNSRNSRKSKHFTSLKSPNNSNNSSANTNPGPKQTKDSNPNFASRPKQLDNKRSFSLHIHSKLNNCCSCCVQSDQFCSDTSSSSLDCELHRGYNHTHTHTHNHNHNHNQINRQNNTVMNNKNYQFKNKSQDTLTSVFSSNNSNSIDTTGSNDFIDNNYIIDKDIEILLKDINDFDFNFNFNTQNQDQTQTQTQTQNENELILKREINQLFDENSKNLIILNNDIKELKKISNKIQGKFIKFKEIEIGKQKLRKKDNDLKNLNLKFINIIDSAIINSNFNNKNISNKNKNKTTDIENLNLLKNVIFESFSLINSPVELLNHLSSLSNDNNNNKPYSSNDSSRKKKLYEYNEELTIRTDKYLESLNDFIDKFV